MPSLFLCLIPHIMDKSATVAGTIDAFLVNTIPKRRYPPPAMENKTKRVKKKVVAI